ncbi:hypothetical protein AB3R30_05910 [Leptolyngbyaceae cyanobacterium UHCC 1019]
MVKQPNFKTVKASGEGNFQAFNQPRRSHFQPLFNLNDRLKRHPIIFWSLIWIAIALPSGFAIGSLMNPNAEMPTGAIAQDSEIKAAQPMPKPVPDAGRPPLWVFGAIALSCTASCFVLAQYIKPIEIQTSESVLEGEFEETIAMMQPNFTQPTLIQPTLEERSPRQIVGSRQPSKQPLKQLQSYESVEVLPFMSPERSPHVQPFAMEWVAATQYLETSLATNDLATNNLTEPVPVTLTPLEDTPPLDWGEARLADVMDLRRRYPLHFKANNNSQS